MNLTENLLNLLRERGHRGEVVFSQHATARMIVRKIGSQEVFAALANACLVEDYPEAGYGPCCLLYGETAELRPLHLVVSYPIRPTVRLITVYEPNPAEWLSFTQRR